ncbi:hypothetical protein ZWY2020_004317 [Hordeum vulgare]|nr:hypothetical protein ZWY2020_004317 [Hordeum vulgare]
MSTSEISFHDMDFDFYRDLPLYCVLHDTKHVRCVAFEGSDIGRRFYGCGVKINKLKKDMEQLNINLKNLERQKNPLDIDHKELKSIHACLSGAVRNIEEDRDETKMDIDFLHHEVSMLKGNKKKTQTVVSDLVYNGSANRYELLKINEILEE